MDISLLIVDDEEVIRDGLERFLSTKEEIHTLYVAADGKEALKIMEENTVHIILCDIKIPFINGIELAQKIYQDYPRMRIVFLTGCDDFQYAKAAVECKAMRYLLKPVAADEIFNVILEAIKEIEEEENFESEYRRLRDMVYEDREKKKDSLFNELLQGGADDTGIISSLKDCLCIDASIPFWMVILKTDELFLAKENRKHESRACIKVTEEALAPFNMPYDCIKTADNNIIILMNTCPQKSRIKDAVFVAMAMNFETYILVEESNICCNFSDCVKEYNRIIVKVDRIIDSVKAYINENLNKDISLQSIAEHICINPNYLSVYFKRKTRMKFSDYIMKVKSDRAKELLLKTDYKIYEIANMVGYEDQRYFSVFFKKMVGCTPSEFRTKYLGR